MMHGIDPKNRNIYPHSPSYGVRTRRCSCFTDLPPPLSCSRLRALPIFHVSRYFGVVSPLRIVLSVQSKYLAASAWLHCRLPRRKSASAVMATLGRPFRAEVKNLCLRALCCGVRVET
jgi:hypothetical protein